ncbi:OmpA family protein (plasmid) [Photobacterium sp. GJ3]|uniref:OmpA family protein n=1 Tax=Photobacterium sp. GJ3 TaxID=2829502 RepID=UPI001B8D5CAF|nr:OmpA family protein [Photobacterium sp. GJ3]QUJ69420.1 OmpA family protein [Photobacterium sp. GJ3]
MSVVSISGIYLMGRIYDKDGAVSKGAKFFPLTYETLVFGDNNWYEEFTYNKKNQLVKSVKSEHPIVFSDQYGKLNILSEDVETLDALSVLGSPVVVKSGEGNKERRVSFFPSRLAPIYQASFGDKWKGKLFELINKINADNDDLFKRSLSEIKVNEMLDNVYNIKDKGDLSNEHYENYYKWVKSLKKSEQDNSLYLLEVPQYYTVTVVFSSSKFLGATVEIKNIPEKITLDGNIGRCTSKVEPVNFLDNSKDTNSIYCATFWIEGNIFDIDEYANKYIEINVDLSTITDEVGDKFFSSRGINSYKLKERIFELPIKSVTGRTTVINGDPISVEESLLLHAPEYYQSLIKKIDENPLGLPQSFAMENGKPLNFNESFIHYVQSYKNPLSTGAMFLEKGVSWQLLSKITYAGLSKALVGQNSGLAQMTLAAANVTGTANAFINCVADLKIENSSLVTQAKKFKGIMEARQIEFVRLPRGFDSFITKSGKVVGELLDKPLSAAIIGMHAWNSIEVSKKAEQAEKKLLNSVLDYGSYIITPSVNKVKSLGEDKDLIKRERDALISLQEKLKSMSVEDVHGSHLKAETLNTDTLYRIDSTTFGFDRATPNFANKSVQSAFDEIGSLLSNLSDPIEIIISGHTCNIGDDEYNLKLSLKRAKSVKKSILNAIKNKSLISLWDERILVFGYGEHEPLVENSNKENRVKNRRVDLLLKFSAHFDYPPNRAELINVEKARKSSLTALTTYDKHIVDSAVEAASMAFDVIVGNIAKAYPLAGLLLVAKSAAEMLSTGYQEFEKVVNQEAYKAGEALKNLAYTDILITDRLFDDENTSAFHDTLMKAYLKRSLALNGLIRLIKKYNYVKYNSNERITLKDFDVEGYIKYYILNDNWGVEGGLTDKIHLDELWLNFKKIDASDGYVLPSSQMLVAAGRMLWNKAIINDDGKVSLKDASVNNKYFPIHYFSAESIDQFQSVFGCHIPDNIDKSIYRNISMSAKLPDSKQWIDFNEFYIEHRQRKLSPFDKIRIVVIVDKDKLDLDDTTILNFPINVEAVTELESLAKTEMMYDIPAEQKVASSNTGYIRKISRAELCDHEAEKIEGDNLWGVIIEPSFYYGMHQIFGTRPLVNYNDRTMKTLFSKKEEDNRANIIGAEKSLKYFYQVQVPGRSETKSIVSHVKKKSKYTFDSHSSARFILTLNPNRQYKFNYNNKENKVLLKSDHIFYEKGFLNDKSKGEKVSFVKVFDNPKVDLYIGQPNKKLFLRGESEINREEKVPNFLSRRFLRGDIVGFDWNKTTLLTVIVRTKAIENSQSQLKTQKFEENCIFLKNQALVARSGILQEDYKYEIDELNCLYRIGYIDYNENNELEFTRAKYEDGLPSSQVSVLQSQYERLDKKDLEKLAVRNLLLKFEKTEIWGNISALKYINILGEEVDGLTPMIYPEKLGVGYEFTGTKSANFVDFKILINGPYNSGLSGAESNEIHLHGRPFEVPSNWYRLSDKKLIDNVVGKIETNTEYESLESDLLDKQKEAEENGIQPHKRDSLYEWVKLNPKDIEELNDGRKKLLHKWMNS